MTADKSLIVLRHGQTDLNASGIYQGHTDSPLSRRGQEQALRAAEALRECRPRRILSSDLQRAQATAQALAEACGRPVEIEPALREIDVGAWAGLSHREVAERYPREAEAMDTDEDMRRGEYGETAAEVADRTAEVAIRTLARIEPGESAVLVGHGFASRVMTARLLGWDVERARSALRGLDNCHWGQLSSTEREWSLIGWNLSQHAAPGATDRSRPLGRDRDLEAGA